MHLILKPSLPKHGSALQTIMHNHLSTSAMELVLLRMLSSDSADSRDDDVLLRLRVRLAGDAPPARGPSIGSSISSLQDGTPGIKDLTVDSHNPLRS